MKLLLESSVLGTMVKVSGFQGVHVLPGSFSSRSWTQVSGLPLTVLTCPAIHSKGQVCAGRAESSLNISNSSTVFFKPQHASASPGGLVKTQIARFHPKTFWVSRSGMEPKNLHFLQVPRWCWWCWSGDHSENLSCSKRLCCKIIALYGVGKGDLGSFCLSLVL